MNLEWHAFSGNQDEWRLCIKDEGSKLDDRVMANLLRLSHRLYSIEWWESPRWCASHTTTFEGSLLEAQAYAVALVRMA